MNCPEKRFFTGIRDPEAEKMIREALTRLAEDIRLQAPPDLAGVFLGGGYGRGEGGVFRKADGRCGLYNDLDLFAVAHPVPRARREEIDAVLSGIGEKWTRELGIDVEFQVQRKDPELQQFQGRIRRSHVLQRTGCELYG